MDKNINLLENLLNFNDEYEWLDFKANWFSKDEIGEYISAISNGAALCGKEFGYIVWGVENGTKKIVGTTVNFDKDIDHEPYKHYLARNLFPSVPFETIDVSYQGQRIVLLIIQSAKSAPTKYKKETYIRIGSSKENIAKFPEWEVKLNNVLIHGIPTITNTKAPEYARDLTFQQLFMYYAAKGIELKRNTFEKTLKLKEQNGEYNVMAYILSDQNNIPIRVSIFSGKTKADPLFSVKEFGNCCIMYSMDKILDYGDAINIIQADERNRISERKDVPLFDYEAFHEAILNAFIHNKWLTLNGPSISIFSDRIEILSFGGLAIDQDIEGFYSGASMPVNEILSSIFLQLRISERSGRGVPKIVSAYGKEAIKIEKNRITVTIPLNKINVIPSSGEVNQKVNHKVNHNFNKSQVLIIDAIRNNPNIRITHMMTITGLSEQGVKKNLRILTKRGTIEHVGATRNGYWEVIDKQ